MDGDRWQDVRAVALMSACIYHGLTAISENVIPPRADTIVKTAEVFERYLQRGKR